MCCDYASISWVISCIGLQRLGDLIKIFSATATYSYYWLLIFCISLFAGSSVLLRWVTAFVMIRQFIYYYLVSNAIPLMLILCLPLLLATNLLHFLTCRPECSIQAYQGFINSIFYMYFTFPWDMIIYM